ncbi:MAG: fatty acid desaturase [Saprospiraceae bacterium]|nr:fatty acid desaturase [Saprospiraceae bacterium]
MSAEKVLIRSIRPFGKERRGDSWFHTITTLGLLCLSFLPAAFGLPWYVKIFSSILMALLMVRMFIIYHDYAHRSILQKSWLAKGIFAVYGVFILAPLSIWKRSHNYHHKHNSKLYSSSIGSYPIVTVDKYKKLTSGEKRTYGFIRHPLTISFGYIFVFIFGMLFRSLYNKPSAHWDSAISLVAHFGMIVLFYFLGGWSMVLFGVWIPFLVACGLGAYLFYAQHNFPGVYYADKEGWTFITAAMESSSFMKMSKLMHWFTGNIGYHHIHHLNEAVPFYRLPEVYDKVSQLQNAKTTSLSIKDIIACFRLKVWDPEQRKMLSWSEI